VELNTIVIRATLYWLCFTKADKSLLLDPVVDRVERNDRLGCFVDRLDRLHRLVDDFTTRLDLADFRSTWSTGGHDDRSFLLVLAYCMETDA